MTKVNKYRSTNSKNVVHNYKDGGLVDKLLQHFQGSSQMRAEPIDPTQPIYSDTDRPDWHDDRQREWRKYPQHDNIKQFGQQTVREYKSEWMRPDVNRDIPLYPTQDIMRRTEIVTEGPTTYDRIPESKYRQYGEGEFPENQVTPERKRRM